jgi:hypothetical protein
MQGVYRIVGKNPLEMPKGSCGIVEYTGVFNSLAAVGVCDEIVAAPIIIVFSGNMAYHQSKNTP